MHEATIHDSHKQIRTQTLQNRRNKLRTKNREKVAGKRHENPMSYKQEIDATMKASIHSEARFFTNRGKI
jgi:hypothetical protein